MINLPDFSRCVQFHELKQKMGVTVIPILPIVEFTQEIITQKKITVPNKEALNLENRLEQGNIAVSYSEIVPDQRGLLTYKGRKVVAYIRDQRRGVGGYKYHLSNCSTMQSMKSQGRIKRYFVTKRDTGIFKVHDLSGYGMRTRQLRLDLCKNCIHDLHVKRLYFAPFSLKEYFSRHDSMVPKTITQTVSETQIQTYAPNQEDLSREYRKAAGYCCQSCGVNCTGNKSLLHLHHCDGNPANNEHENLRVFCVDCHSKQPFHTQVAHPTKAQQQIREIKKLRAEQGIPDLD